MSIIIKEFIEKSNESNIENINNIKLNRISNNTLYNKVNALSNYNIVKYIFICIVIFYVLHSFTINLNTILASFIVIILIYYLINNSDNTDLNDIDFNEKLDYLESLLFKNSSYDRRKNPFKHILNILPNNMPPERKSYLHLSRPVVEFYYSVRELSQYNPANFKSSLDGINNILKLSVVMQVGTFIPKNVLDNAELQSSKCLNSLQSIIYSIPSNETYNKFFNNSLNSLKKIINLYLSSMTDIVENKFENEIKNNSLNIYSKPIYKNTPNENDTNSITYSKHFNFY